MMTFSNQAPPRASALALGALLLVGCFEPESPPPPNLLVIAVDTLRADHLGAYGYERPTSPNLDQFMKGAVVFEDAHSTSAWTLPSFASMMTSVHSSTHGCWQFTSRLDPSFTTLAEALHDEGYYTGAILSHVFLGSRYGFNQGFDHFDEELVFEGMKDSHQAISSPPITKKVIDFLDQRADEEGERPWFLFAHFFDPHAVYKRHRELELGFGIEEKIDLYDGEIAFTDLHIGRVLMRLKEHRLDKNTIVVFVADHGEEFWDHGTRGHGRTLYREVERIPFAIRVPGQAARRVKMPVSGIDFMPTMLELTETPVPKTPMAGRSLVPLMRGEEQEELGILLESRLNLRKDANLEAYVRGRWKLIVETPKTLDGTPIEKPEPRLMLFDRSVDPTEENELSAEQPKVTQSMLRDLRKAVKAAQMLSLEYAQATDVEMSAERLQELRSLGYLGETVDEDKDKQEDKE